MISKRSNVFSLFAISLVLLLSMSGLLFAQQATSLDLIKTQSSGTGFFAQNWFNNWQLAGLAAVGAMVAIIALCYMGGQLLQLEDLKSFARAELVQAGGSVLLLLLILLALAMADRTMAYLTDPNSSSHIFSPCQAKMQYPTASLSNAPMLNQFAYCYVNNLETLAAGQGDAILRQSVDYAQQAYRMIGFQTDQELLLYLSSTYRPNANLRLDSEVKGQEFDILSKFLISLQGQKYFIGYIVPVLGPGLLVLGLILRCLSFTRRLGGLLVASGLGLMIILPATYLLAWFTLQVAVFGPQALGDQKISTCPSECRISAPLAYNTSLLGANGKNIPGAGPDADGKIIGWSSGTDYSLNAAALDEYNYQNAPAPALSPGDEIGWNAAGVQVCFPRYADQTKDSNGEPFSPSQPAASPVPLAASINCPAECRFLPIPTTLQCNETACNRLPLSCLAIRASPNAQQASGNEPYARCASSCPSSVCPDFCKLTLPQVKYAGPGDAGAVVPTPNANACAGRSAAGSCASCPNYCRAYTSENGALVSPTADCSGCASCFALQDAARVDFVSAWTRPPSPSKAAGVPDCLTGIPAIRAKDCNDANLCGSLASFKDIVAFDANGIPKTTTDASGKATLVTKGPISCPLECRVSFDENNGQKKYEDPFWKYCQLDPIQTACSSCPIYCKVNVSTALGVPASCSAPGADPATCGQPVVVTDPLNPNQPVTCAIPPTFDSTGQMSSTVNSNCGRCPLDCRLSNPNSINDQQGSNLLRSSAHYAMQCEYLDSKQHVVKDANGNVLVQVSGDSIQYTSSTYASDPSPPLSPENGGCLKGWYKGAPTETIDYVAPAPSPAPPLPTPAPPPVCAPPAPNQQVYRLAPGQSTLCPQFFAPATSFGTLISQPNPAAVITESDPTKVQSDVYVIASIPSNADVSPECSTPDAQKFCLGSDAGSNPYCPSSCLVDRAAQGPFVCNIADITNPYSTLPDNSKYCQKCSVDNSLDSAGQPDHTLGPQCQVLLAHGADAASPQGCSSACAPTANGKQLSSGNPPIVDPRPPAPSCDGFCYPRLTVPSSSDNAACADYVAGADSTAISAANGASCPYSCRYDYLTANGPAMSDAAAQACGMYTAPSCAPGKSGYPNCFYNGIYAAHPCNQACNGLVPDDADAVAQCRDDAFTCTQRAAGDYWVRSEMVSQPGASDCDTNVVKYDLATHYDAGDNGAPYPWYVGPCVSATDYQNDPSSFTLFNLAKNSKPYDCKPGHKYPAIDKMIASSLGVSDYYECGFLNYAKATNNVNANPDLNFCGSVTINKKVISALPGACQAQYNARAVACLPYGSYVQGTTDSNKNPLGTATQPILASGDCQQCPLFCRIDGSTGFKCPTNLGGPKSACTSPASCDTRTTPGADPPQPPGYCGVPASAFHLAPSGSCALPTPGSGAGCPARCRLLLPDGSMPAGCDTPEIGQACKTMDHACRAGPSANPCASCNQCELDCQAKPYVRQNCDELCSPSDATAGASHLTPDQLTSSFAGAQGNALWNSLGSLGIAAIILPIFCILLTLAFIRSLSPLLGGDFEIPGLLKLI